MSMSGQNDYPTLQEIKAELEGFSSHYSESFQLQNMAETAGDNEVWLGKIGTAADEDLTPGFLLISGVDGAYPAGTQSVLTLAEKLLTEDAPEGSRLIDNYFFYIVPVLNPDAYVQYHSDLVYERKVNGREYDIDRDGRISEDPFNDLNDDGLITVIRIEDQAGKYIQHSEDERIMKSFDDRPTDATLYRIISEGYDMDKDGEFNEDGPGGIDLNKNFSFDYPAFEPTAGDHAVSELENRALADFLFSRWNIYAVFTFALENNLMDPLSFDPKNVSKRVIDGPLEGDAEFGNKVGKLFEEHTELSDVPKMKQGPGSFSSWAYFHYGRYSFVSPAWWAPMPVADESEGEENKKDNSEDSMGYDGQFIKWAESEGLNDFFVSWTAIEHPDFKDSKCEVGGFKPFVRYNPPVQYLEENNERYFSFLKSFCGKMPELSIENVDVESLDNGVYRLSGRVINNGGLPTHSELGDRTRWVRNIRHRLLLDDSMEVLVGSARSFHQSLKPGEYFEFNWLISGEGRVVLEAASPMTGTAKVELDLD